MRYQLSTATKQNPGMELRERQEKLQSRKEELRMLIMGRKTEVATPQEVAACAADLRNLLEEGSLVERKAFVRSFVNEVKVTGREVLLSYTVPMMPTKITEEKIPVLDIVHHGGPTATGNQNAPGFRRFGRGMSEVGLLCREALISVSQAVYDPDRHKALDRVVPSDTDAGRILESIFVTELQGSANEESRAHAKAALRLALALQHKRTADYRMAALCTEATVSVVNLLAVISGRRRVVS